MPIDKATAGTDHSIDYFGDELLALNPYPLFDRLARARPVWREPRNGVVMVCGYEEALTVMRDQENYSVCNIVAGPVPAFPVPPSGDDITDFIEQHRDSLPMSDQIIAFDPPRHTAHRALLMGLITPKRLKENEEFIWRLTDRELDRVLAKSTCDFMNEYAHPYTLLVVADLLGVPESDHEMLLGLMGHAPRAPADQPHADREDAAPAGHPSLEPLYGYFIRRIEERRRKPARDVLTGMALARFPDGTLPEPVDVARIAANLFAAGQETTVRLLGTCLRRLAEDQDLQRTVRERRELIPRLIEEVLRTEGPIKGNFRLARKTNTVGGVKIPAGTTLMVMNGAANRDARQFEAPAEFLLERPNTRRHIAFGHGIHTCPGAPLARSEVRITLERLFDRTPGIKISEAAHGPAGRRRYDYMRTYQFRGLTTLTLDFR
jgi:cytochrome P450 family 150 subfamily A5